MTNAAGQRRAIRSSPRTEAAVASRGPAAAIRPGLDGNGHPPVDAVRRTGGQHPVYSPDGKRVAFIRGSQAVGDAVGRKPPTPSGSRRRALDRGPHGRLMAGRSQSSPANAPTCPLHPGRSDGSCPEAHVADRRRPRRGFVQRRATRPQRPDGRVRGVRGLRPRTVRACECEVYALYRRPLARGIASRPSRMQRLQRQGVVHRQPGASDTRV